MKKKRVLSMVISMVLTVSFAFPVCAQEMTDLRMAEDLDIRAEQEQQQDDIVNGMSVFEIGTYLLEKTPEKIVSELNMSKVPDWQFGGSGSSYGRNDFYVNWYDWNSQLLNISVKCIEESDISILGISCGTSLEKVNQIMKKEGWYPDLYERSESASYYKEEGDARYIFDVDLTADKKVQQWYWCDWPQGDLWYEPYNDVPWGAWFYNPVLDVSKKWIMKGTSPGYFSPAQSLARAQLAVILHRMNDEPKVAYTSKFPDVPDGQWYTDAVLWANSSGVVNGYEDSGLFGVGDNINREQMAVMMYRYAQYKKYDTSQKVDFSRFQDASRVNEFAKEAMQWAVGSGIITGKDNGTKMDPQGNANRAECATIIARFIEKYL